MPDARVIGVFACGVSACYHTCIWDFASSATCGWPPRQCWLHRIHTIELQDNAPAQQCLLAVAQRYAQDHDYLAAISISAVLRRTGPGSSRAP